MLSPFDLELFVAIADTGSLSAAARVTGVTRATITRRLAALEESLGVALVNRTTRELSLTEAGSVYCDACRETLTRLREAEASVQQLDGTPRGTLRIACPIICVELITGPLVAAFSHCFPEVQVHAVLTSEPINPIVDGFDMAVQIGFERNPSLIARCVSRERYRLYASPGYLERRGTPETVNDLVHHDCVLSSIRGAGAPEPWPLIEGGTLTIDRPRLVANASSLVRTAVVESVGIGLIAGSLVREDLAEGRLVPVLTTEVGQVLPVSILFPANLKPSAKVRCFVDFATEWVAHLVSARMPPDMDEPPRPQSRDVDATGARFDAQASDHVPRTIEPGPTPIDAGRHLDSSQTTIIPS